MVIACVNQAYSVFLSSINKTISSLLEKRQRSKEIFSFISFPFLCFILLKSKAAILNCLGRDPYHHSLVVSELERHGNKVSPNISLNDHLIQRQQELTPSAICKQKELLYPQCCTAFVSVFLYLLINIFSNLLFNFQTS